MHEYFLQLVQPRVSPEAGSSQMGLPLDGGATAPFVVDRGWVGPAGTYIEEWSIRRGEQVLYRHPPAYIQVRGHQTVRRFADVVRTPLALEPGPYDITFVIQKYRMGSFSVDAAPLSELTAAAAATQAPPGPPARRPTPAPRPAPAAAQPSQAAAAPAAPAPAYTGEDPAAARQRVYQEELAKGSDPRVAEARAKSAEMRAKKAAAASGAAASAAPAAAAAPAAQPTAEPAPAAAQAAPVAAGSRVARLAAQAPPGGGGMTVEQAAAVRQLVYAEAIEKGSRPEVAEAQAKAAEIRARRGPWWAPDWK